MDQLDNKINPSRVSETVKAIVILLFSGVFAYKMIVTPLSLAMDFYALLSLLLALFSVALSALFYFKATDTSNTFYDNTYKFTKDIAELLVRIESGFGERLRHLDEGYTRIQDRVYSHPKEDLAEKQEQVKEEEKNFNAKLAERDKLIEELVQKSQLEGKEKQSFLDQLKAREDELSLLQTELTTLRKQANELRRNEFPLENREDILERVRSYSRHKVIKGISSDALNPNNTVSTLQDAWRNIRSELPLAFLYDLQELGFLTPNNLLTRNGVNFLRALPPPPGQNAYNKVE